MLMVVSNSGDNESICNDSLLSVRGVPSNSVPLVDIVAPSIKKDIIAGRYVNLASLLISSSNDSAVRELSLGTSSILLKPLADSRLNRPLTLSEFIVAFNIYKKVMCSAYPQRREELDEYLSDIIKMANDYKGLAFYEYHKRFAKNAAQLFIERGLKVDWGIRDQRIFVALFTGQKANTCLHCNGLHLTNFCPEASGRKLDMPARSKDKYGRDISRVHGKQICNNYNHVQGCAFANCQRAHVCTFCFKNHPLHKCQENKQTANHNSK